MLLGECLIVGIRKVSEGTLKIDLCSGTGVPQQMSGSFPPCAQTPHAGIDFQVNGELFARFARNRGQSIKLLGR